jgi:cell wall-associated NlpC family hydrolase
VPADLVSVAPPSRYGGTVGVAMQYLGTPYRWGGSDPSGFDCSGFVMYVYSQMGVSLPHNAAAQFAYGTPVSRDQLEPGDIVFFDGLGHNGLYIGGGQFIHSPPTGDVVKISSLYDSWYSARWVGGRRIG